MAGQRKGSNSARRSTARPSGRTTTRTSGHPSRKKVGSGGKRSHRLEGKGPTPKAENRPYHAAYTAKQEREVNEHRQAAAQERYRLSHPRSLVIRRGYEAIAGRNPVIEAVHAGVPIARVFLNGASVHDDRLSEIVQAASANGAPVLEATHTQLDRLTDNAVHQGIVIEVPPYTYADLDDLEQASSARTDGQPGLIVALDSVTDPHNLGAVLRSASAFHADGVLIPERRSAGVNATVWKTSAGAAAHVPVAREANLVTSLKRLQADGYFVVGLDGAGDTSIDRLELVDAPLVLVVGSEGKGMGRLVRETCDTRASIPIASRMESLNAAVAAGIALYQIDRLRAVRTS
ncbi:MAG: 23S rRNA (guanosine(2251)-2'-O)-methyltransferase RlmB [Actinomycetaceae bacterium]|nr:23S rRNA (guanosine(2251)-2'-O)-methyltransferase RlmB [Actinomycetaceae bacterium]MDY6082477.1 23S rRNA (guanosine(2251)-2'-O)-methyltransferase RlmB [Actinomycetaceae bacterium]